MERRKTLEEKTRYEPAMSADEREALLTDWHRAVDRARGWAGD